MPAAKKNLSLAVQDPKVLATMSERAFADYYSQVMGLEAPITRVKGGEARVPYIERIERMVAEMKERGPQPLTDREKAEIRASMPPEDVTATEPVKKPKKDRTPKPPKEPRPKKEPKRRERKLPPERIDPVPDIDNPFRTGTFKHEGFGIFKKGGAWKAVLEKIQALGVKEATAENWMTYAFARVCEGGPAQVNRRREAAAAKSEASAESQIVGEKGDPDEKGPSCDPGKPA